MNMDKLNWDSANSTGLKFLKTFVERFNNIDIFVIIKIMLIYNCIVHRKFVNFRTYLNRMHNVETIFGEEISKNLY